MASVYTQKLLHKDAFTHRSFYTQQAFTHKIFYTQQALTHSKRLRTEHLHTVLLHMASVYTQNTYTQRFYTWQAFTHTASFLNREAFTHRGFYTQQAFTQRSFYTQQAFTHSKRLHTGHLHTMLLHMATAYTHRNFYTEMLLQTEKLLHTASFYTQNLLHTVYHNRTSTPKQQKHDFEALFKRSFKTKITSAKIEKSADKSLLQPWCSHSNTIYETQLQKTIVLPMQPRHRATFMQPFQCDLPPQLQETQRTTHTGTTTRCKTHRRNTSRQKRPQPHPPHTRCTFHRRVQPLYTEKHKVSCSGFLPKT